MKAQILGNSSIAVMAWDLTPEEVEALWTEAQMKLLAEKECASREEAAKWFVDWVHDFAPAAKVERSDFSKLKVELLI